MRVIGTVGLPGSGKGEAAAVAREAGVPVVTMGDVIREACRDRGLDPAEHHGEVARALREENGPAAIAERSLPTVEAKLADRNVVLVDGLRSDVELDRFRDAFGDAFRLMSVEAPFETRADRLLDRARDDTDLDRAALREREERELGFGMGEVMDRADVVIENTETLDAYRERVRAVLEGDLNAVADSECVHLRGIDVDAAADAGIDAAGGGSPSPKGGDTP
jgi:dephospho-CoA kinase